MTARGTQGGISPIVLAVLLGACEGPPSGGPSGKDGLPLATWTIDSTSSVRIGSATEGPPEHLFAGIRHVARLSDGRFVVVDGRSFQIRWFDVDGGLDAQSGREGSGPGEFGRVAAASLLPGDTLVLFDTSNQRLTWFDPAGARFRELQLPIGSNLRVGLYSLAVSELLVVVETPHFNFGGAEYNLARDSILAVRVPSTGAPDTVLRLAGREAATWVEYVDGRPVATRQVALPFAEATLLAVAGGDIVVARTGDGTLDLVDLEGSRTRRGGDGVARGAAEPVPARSIEVPGRPRTVLTREVRERHIGTIVPRLTASGVPETMAREGQKATLGLLPDGRRIPAFDRLLVDPEQDHIWLRDFVSEWALDEPRGWTVLDREGTGLARIMTPADLDVTQVAGGWIAGVARDTLGVEYAMGYAVGYPPP